MFLPAKESLDSEIPAENGKNEKKFYSVYDSLRYRF